MNELNSQVSFDPDFDKPSAQSAVTSVSSMEDKEEGIVLNFNFDKQLVFDALGVLILLAIIYFGFQIYGLMSVVK